MEHYERNESNVSPNDPIPLPRKSNTGILIFIAGHMYDKNCNYGDLIQDVVKVICTISPMHFRYDSEFDQKGVLSWFRDVSSSKVIDKERIIISKDKITYIPDPDDIESCSSSIEILGKTVKGLFETKVSLTGDNCPVVDLQQFKLRLTHITVSFESNYEREIEFYGSDDRISWVRIDVATSEENDKKGNEFQASSKARTWELQSNEYYRYYKVLLYITTQGGRNFYRWALAGLELYGDLI
jgi:hypothetical protein